MKRKIITTTSSSDQSTSSLNDIGIHFYREMKLSDALYHFQWALHSATLQDIDDKLIPNDVKRRKVNAHFTSNISMDENATFEQNIKSQYDEGFYNFLNVQSIKPNYINEKAILSFNIGVVYHKMNKHNDALSFYYKSINLLQYEEYDTLLTSNLCNIGTIYYFNEEYEKALGFYKDALEFGNYNDIIKSFILNCMGVLTSNTNSQDENSSMRYFNESLDICSKGNNNDHLIATILINMGRIFLNKKNMFEAEQAFKKALSIRQSIYGENSIKVAQVIKNLAHLYNVEGNYLKEEQMYRIFLKNAHDTRNWLDLEVATILQRLGQLYQKSKQYNKAIECYNESIFLHKTILGPYNSQSTTILNNLGYLCYEMDDNDMAIQYYRQELMIEMHLNNSRNVITTLVNLAEIYKKMENYEYSFSLYKRAATMQETVFGKHHLDLSITFSNLGFVLYQKGDYPDCITMYQRALKIRSDNISMENDVESASILTQLGLAYIQSSKWSLALEALSQSIKIRQCVDEETSLTLSNIGMIYEYFGDEQQALSNYQKALDIEMRVLGCEHEEVSRLLFRIGRIHMNLGAADADDDHLENALKNFNMALHIQKKKDLGENDAKLSIARTMNCIGNVYLQRGETDKSMEFFIEASRIFRVAGVSDETLEVFSPTSSRCEQCSEAAPAA